MKKWQQLFLKSARAKRWTTPTCSHPMYCNINTSTMYHYSSSAAANHFPLTGTPTTNMTPLNSTPNLSNRVHLTQNQQELLVREQKLIESIINLLKKYDSVSKRDLELLEKSKNQLEDFFLVVCVGEFNAGKSSFLNALLGDKILAEGAIPTTTALHMIKYGGKSKQELDPNQNLIQVELPLAWLKGISLVDTPGTNAVIREHQFITENFVPRSDLILFLTSAERPFSESEKEFMMHIREWGKKVVLVINKFDLMQNDFDQKQVLQFVRSSVVSLLGFEPRIFCVSSKQALLEKRQLQFSKFTETKEETTTLQNDINSYEWKDMEDYILATLNSIERVQLKMENPLGVADNLTKKYMSNIEKRLFILQEDLHTVETIENQLKLYREETAKDFQMHQQKLLNIFLEMKNRSQIFFDEFVRWNNIRDLWNPRKVEEAFNREVIGNFVVEVERHISEVIDWMIDRKYKQWKMITDFVQKRATRLSQELYPSSETSSSSSDSIQQQNLTVKGDFQFNRRDLILSIGKAAESVITSYNRKEDVDRLNSSIAASINSVSTVSLSTIALTSGIAIFSPAIVAAASLQTAILGIAGAALSIAMSMTVLGWKRRQNRKKFQTKVDSLHAKLKQAVEDKFIFELDQTVESIKSDVSPYVRFVRSENAELDTLRKELEQSKKMIANMRTAIGLLATDANASASLAKEATTNLQLSTKEFGESNTTTTTISSNYEPGSVFKNLEAELKNK